MTISSRTAEAHGAEPHDQLVTSEFAPLADFAGFGVYEAAAVQETGKNIPALSERIARGNIQLPDDAPGVHAPDGGILPAGQRGDHQ